MIIALENPRSVVRLMGRMPECRGGQGRSGATHLSPRSVRKDREDSASKHHSKKTRHYDGFSIHYCGLFTQFDGIGFASAFVMSAMIASARAFRSSNRVAGKFLPLPASACVNACIILILAAWLFVALFRLHLKLVPVIDYAYVAPA